MMLRALRTSALVCLFAATFLAVVLSGCRPQSSTPSLVPEALTPTPKVTVTYPLTLKDDLGKEVTLKAEPKRIVSLSPPLTESAFALGLGDRVVGVTRFCNFPKETEGKEKIGGVSDPSVEKILALNPDLVLATVGNPMPVLEALEKSQIPVLSLDPKTYDGVAEALKTLGRVCGVPEAGEKLAKQMRDTAAEIQAKVAQVPEDKRPRALLVVWLDPLFVAGPKTYMDDMLRICGARNVAAQTENPWKQFSLEMAVAENPQVLILTAEHTPGAKDVETQLAELRKSTAWRSVDAVKTGRVTLIPADLVTRTGPRLQEALKLLSQAVYPDLFPPSAGVGPSH